MQVPDLAGLVAGGSEDLRAVGVPAAGEDGCAVRLLCLHTGLASLVELPAADLEWAGHGEGSKGTISRLSVCCWQRQHHLLPSAPDISAPHTTHGRQLAPSLPVHTNTARTRTGLVHACLLLLATSSDED